MVITTFEEIILRKIRYRIAEQRMADLKKGRLKLRPINKPIHKPSENDTIAKRPKEWQEELNFIRAAKS